MKPLRLGLLLVFFARGQSLKGGGKELGHPIVPAFMIRTPFTPRISFKGNFRSGSSGGGGRRSSSSSSSSSSSRLVISSSSRSSSSSGSGSSSSKK